MPKGINIPNDIIVAIGISYKIINEIEFLGK
jgi:hypothetical protein